MTQQIDKTTIVRGIGRWPAHFGNKLISCVWNPEDQAWTSSSTGPDVKITEDPEFFVQRPTNGYLKVKR